ncbi:MAG: TPM domain-containing protein [Deltaproteobacteria bacterium]|nr:TPM domain-containing protein [Deltaproteobacteria bacterium]
MRAKCLSLGLAAALILGLAGGTSGFEFPEPQGAVNDFANVIKPQPQRAMESLAREVQQKTGVALVVATFSDIGGQDIESFANELYSAWGIGQKGEDKGVLFLVALKERRFRIETGYGVEGILPDGKLGRIRDAYILPYFKKGLFDQGLENGLKAVAAVVAEEAGVKLTGAPQPVKVKTRRTGSSLGALFFLVVLAMIFFGARRRGSRGGLLSFLILGSILGSGRGGGGFGGFSGGFGGFGGGMSGGGGVSGSF